MNGSRWWKSRLLLLSWAIALGIGVLVVVQLLESRSAISKRALAANTNLLFTVGDVLERTLQQADRGLEHSVTLLEKAARDTGVSGGSPPSSPAMLQSLNAGALFAATAENGYGSQLVLDQQGRILASSQPPPPGDWVFAHREYFKIHQNDAHAGLFIGSPFIPYQQQQPSVAMSRRWNLADGSFGGVVVQTMRLSALHSLFSSFELGADSGINVFLSDGSVMARFPYTGEHVGRSLKGTANFERFVSEGQGSFIGRAALDDVERMYVFRRLENYPIIVNVAQSTRTLLGGWLLNALGLGAATLLLMCACVLLAIFAERGLRAHRQTSNRLWRTERELRTIVDSLPVMVAYWDRELINRMSNITHLHWLGVAPEQILGRHLKDVRGEEEYRFLLPYVEATLAGAPQTFERSIVDGNGATRHAITNFIPDWEEGKVKGFFVLVTDISQPKAAAMALFEEKERFRVILESIREGVITTDAQGRILYLNPAAESMTGWRLGEARGRLMEEVMCIEPPTENEPLVCPLREALEQQRINKDKLEHVLVSRSGERLRIENSAAPILDEKGSLRGAVVVFHDSGPVRAMANEMIHLAQHDALTGLPNRRRLDQAGQQALLRAASSGQRLAVLYLDLDGFKQVNDEYGHAVGDELLVAVTRRLSARLRTSDSMYRQGGDEFVVLMERISTFDEAQNLALRLIESCQMPVGVSGRRFTVTVSIGISLYPNDATALAELVQHADRGMYAAKNAGRNRHARIQTYSADKGASVSV